MAVGVAFVVCLAPLGAEAQSGPARDLEGHWLGWTFSDSADSNNDPNIAEFGFGLDAEGQLGGYFPRDENGSIDGDEYGGWFLETDNAASDFVRDTIDSGTVEITADGIVSATFNLASEDEAKTFSNLQLNASGELLAGVLPPSSRVGLTVVAKIDSDFDYSVADLEGHWAFFEFSDNTQQNSPRSERGEFEIDATGEVTGGSRSTPQGPQPWPEDLQFSINKYGLITETSGGLGGEPKLRLSEGRQVAAGTAIGFLPGGGGDHGLLFLVKRTRDVLASDLVGDVRLLALGPNPLLSNQADTLDGFLKIEPDGFIHGPASSSAGIEATLWRHIDDVRSNGEFTAFNDRSFWRESSYFGHAVSTGVSRLFNNATWPTLGSPGYSFENGPSCCESAGLLDVLQLQNPGTSLWNGTSKDIKVFGYSDTYLAASLATERDLLVVGVPGWPPYGAFFVYLRQLDGTLFRLWSQTDPTDPTVSVPSAWPGEAFGSSLAIFDRDILVGNNRYGDCPNCPGRALIYEETIPGSNQWLFSHELKSADTLLGDGFGLSVALAENTAVVGANQHGDDGAGTYLGGAGAVHVFTTEASSWSPPSGAPSETKLLPSDGQDGDGFGSAVSISGDTLLVGAPEANGNEPGSGAAYVFTRSDDNWTEVAKWTGDEGASGDRFGFSVAIEGDLAVVGAPGAANGVGRASIYQRRDGQWSRIATRAPFSASPVSASVLAATGPSAFGASVHIVDTDENSCCGALVTVGAPGGDFVGPGTPSTANTGYAYFSFPLTGNHFQYSPQAGIAVGSLAGNDVSGLSLTFVVPEPGPPLLGGAALFVLAALRRGSRRTAPSGHFSRRPTPNPNPPARSGADPR